MLSKKEFTEQVEVLLSKGATVMDAIIKVCEVNKIEPESTKRLLSDPLKQRLEAEAKKLNMVNRGNNSQASLTTFFK
tara:strand:+ start:197 stop:427 length:231 start_codon:yes stop_codon:yes gene_type:complete